MSAIKTKETELQIASYEKVTYPAILLGRLAVDNTERGKGIGKYLINHCITFAFLRLRKKLGVVS